MLIRCENAGFGYENQLYVRNVNFTLEEGDYLCVLGENGSGKSTLMKGLLGLLRPYEGKVVYGSSIKGMSIGYLPQKTEAQKDFPATVREVVISGCLSRRGMRPFWSREDRMRAEKQMERLKVKELEKECFRDLSGGQQQRVLLARALCATEHLLLLDEPTTGLDPSVTRELYDLLRTLNRDDHTAILMVSHDIDNALSDATHVLHMEKEMLFFGTTEEYVQSRAGKAFLDNALSKRRGDALWR